MIIFIECQTDYKLPGLELNKQDLKQIRRAHKYVGWKLNQFENYKTTKYALYLAVKNYSEQLEQLKRKIITTIGNYIVGTNNMVYGTRNVILGSNKKIAGQDNWVVSQR